LVATRTAETARYTVQSWNQWQTPVQLDNSGPQLWNGQFGSDSGGGNPFFSNDNSGGDSTDSPGNPAASEGTGVSTDVSGNPVSSDNAGALDPNAADGGDTIEIIGN